MIRPGGVLTARPLHFIWIVDCSGSMAADGKIQALNTAIREAIPHMQQMVEDNPNADVLVRAIRFSTGASWHVAVPTPVHDFRWTDVSADGVTDLGKALSMIAEQLKIPPMTARALPPILVLLSDGFPTDDFASGLADLLAQPWGRKAIRVAIAIGHDADQDILQQFIGHAESKPLLAQNADQLVRYIKWASTALVRSASEPASQPMNNLVQEQFIPIPAPPSADTLDDVW